MKTYRLQFSRDGKVWFNLPVPDMTIHENAVASGDSLHKKSPNRYYRLIKISTETDKQWNAIKEQPQISS